MAAGISAYHAYAAMAWLSDFGQRCAAVFGAAVHGGIALPFTQSRQERLDQVEQWIKLGKIDPDAGNFDCLRLTDEEERFLIWLHSPNPTEPVLAELDGRVLPAVKFSVDDGIFALYVMDCMSSPSLESDMVFAGLYDPKALTLYVDGASSVLADLPFASAENLRDCFLESAEFALECVAAHMESAPELLRGMSKDIWDVFQRAYPSVLHEVFIYGGTPRDVLHIYADALVQDLAPDWNKDMAAAFLGDEHAFITRYLDESVPDEAYVLCACARTSICRYWQQLEDQPLHPAHQLRAIADACRDTKGEFVQFDLMNGTSGARGSIIMPKFYFADGSFGAFDTRRWPERVREALKDLFPDSFGCFHVSDVCAVREVFTGRLLYDCADPDGCVSSIGHDAPRENWTLREGPLLPEL